MAPSTLSVGKPSPTPAAGVAIELANTITDTLELGGIGFRGIAFAPIAGGTPATRTRTKPISLVLTGRLPTPAAGAAVPLVASSISLGKPTPEIGSRRRKLKGLGIAS
jgi:hypothetical protein